MSKQSAEQKRLARKRHKAEIRAAQYKASKERQRQSGEKKHKIVHTQHKRPGGYSHAILDARLEVRRNEAKARQAEHDALPVTHKIAKAKSRRGQSLDEVTRLRVILNTKVKYRVDEKQVA